MSEIINIASFDFDSSKLYKSLEEVTAGMIELKQAQNEVKMNSQLLQKDINKLAKENDTLAKTGRKNSDTYNDNDEKIRQLNQSQATLIKDTLRIQGQQSKLRTEYKQTRDAIDNLNKVNEINIKDYQITGKNVEQLKSEYSSLVKIRDKMVITVGEENESTKMLNKAIEANVQARKNEVSESEKRFFTVGEYQKELKSGFDSVRGSLDQLRSGNLTGFFSSITTGFKGITKAALAFIATPIGAFITILTATGLAFKKMFDYNKSIIPQIQLVDHYLGLSGEQADKTRVSVKAMSDAYNIGFEDILKTAEKVNNLDLTSGIEETLELISVGLASYPDKAAYLRDLENSVMVAKQLGLDLKQVIAINANAVASGANIGDIYNALGLAIKNVGKENKALASDLTTSFGKEFTENIFNKINQGSITTIEFLDKIYEKSKEVGVSNQQQMALAIDLFGKGAVAAGGYESILKSIYGRNVDMKDVLTTEQLFVFELNKAYEAAGIAKDKALKSDNILAFQKTWELVWQKIQQYFWEAISFVIDKMNIVTDVIIASGYSFISVFKSFPEAIKKAFNQIKTEFTNLVQNIKTGAKVIKDVLTFDFTSAKKNFMDFKNNTIKNVNDIKNIGSDFSRGIADKFTGTFKNVSQVMKSMRNAAAELQKIENKSKEDEKAKEKAAQEAAARRQKAAEGIEKAAADRKKQEAEEQKAATEKLRLLKSMADSNINLMKLELAAYLQNNKSRLKDAKRLTSALIDEEQKRLDAILNKNINILNSEEETKISEVENSVKNEKERQIKIEEIQLEYKTKRAEEINKTNEQNKVNQEQYDEQLRNQKESNDLINYQTRLEDLKNQGATEFEIKQAQLDQEWLTNQERKKVEEELDAINQEELELQKDDINAQLDEATLARKVALAQALINIDYAYGNASLQVSQEKNAAEYKSYASVAGGVSKILGEQTVLGKAAAIAETTINTYTAAQSAFSSQASIPIIGPALGAIAGGVAIASGLANVAKIAGVNVGKVGEGIAQTGGAAINLVKLNKPTLEGFSTGGYTGNGKKDEVAGLVHGGEIVWSQEDIKKVGGINIAESMRPTSIGYASTNSVNTTTVQQSVVNNFNIESISDRIKQGVYEGSMLGTHAGSQQGIGNLNDNISIKDGSNH